MLKYADSGKVPAHRRLVASLSKTHLARNLAISFVALVGASAANARTLYVNGGKTSSGNGSSWSTSIRYLQDALDIAKAGDVVWLAKGTYFPDDGVPNGFGDREISFEINGLTIYGGFSGNETSLGQRNVTANPTILSGKIWEVNPNDPLTLGNDRYWSLHVLTASGNCRLDGLTVEGGRASGETAPYSRGGGVLVSGTQTLRLANCIFRENMASQSGGAVYGAVNATNCQFIDNFVNNEFNFNSNPTRIKQWVFNSVCSGGAIQGAVEASRCKFINNSINIQDLDSGTTCSATGGAINGTKVKVTDCEFDGNSIFAYATYDSSTSAATGRGGAISGPTTATRSVFTNNSIYTYADSATSPSNAIAHHTSRPSSFGAAIAGQATVMSCAFEDNSLISNAGETDPANGIAFGFGGDETRAYCAGSAVYLEGASSVANSTFVRNSSEGKDGTEMRGGWYDVRGALLVASGGSLPLSNSTFLNNLCNGYGAGLAIEGTCNVISNVFWANETTSGIFQNTEIIHVGERSSNAGGGRGRISNRLYPTPSTETINLCLGGFSAVTRSSGSIVDFGEPADRTFIPLDPAFVDIADPNGADDKWGTGDDGLRLTSASPAIGKGIRQFLAKDTADLDSDGNTTEEIPNDLAGYVRVQGGSLDLGAYEFGQAINAPDISVEYPGGTILADGQDTVDLSTFAAQPRTFVIRNTGNEVLANLAVAVTGANSSDYVITQPVLKGLSINATTTFTVTFRPKAVGNRVAQLRIASNDPDENPFDITLNGNSALPDIAVEYPVGTGLTSGSSTVDYGTIDATSSSTRTFTIRNTGAGNLQIDSINVTGGDASSFKASAPAASFLIPGASTTFTVSFSGAAGDALASTIIIGNSDPDAEAAFKINVKGFGKRSPEIVLSQPFSSEIKSGDVINYGSVDKDSSYTKTFVIKNTGTAGLTGINVKLSGSSNFSRGKFNTKKLKPGASVEFTVTFNPTSKGDKSATLKVISNDANEGQINLTLKGKGVKKGSGSNKAKNKARSLAAAFSAPAATWSAQGQEGSITTVTGDDGLKYQTLTVGKVAGQSVGTVEVSSNLVDWFSGSRHTTTLVDSASVLKVRDNTPVKQGEKRYIRLK